jgi:TIR domain
MSGLPYNKRPNDVFVSYSHADGMLVEPLVRWLRDIAGLRVRWDTNRLVAGDRLAAALPTGLASARAALFCVSRSWIASPWCEDEYNAALQERRADRRYRVIALRLEDCQVPTFLSNVRYLEMQQLEVDMAATLLETLVPEPALWSHGERDVYLSRSWHADDAEAADRVCTALGRDHGFRLIGDSPDYAAFDGEDRVKRIIESCGALVAVLPFRDDAANGFTSKWIVREVQIARQLGRPYILFTADGVKVEPSLLAAAISSRAFPLSASADDGVLAKALALFEDEYAPSPRLAYAFFATSLRGEARETDHAVALVEHVTSMPCLLGQRLQGQHAQQEIVERIRKPNSC